MDEHPDPRDGPISDRPPVGAMHGSGAVPTAWTHRGTPPGLEVKMPGPITPSVRQEAKRDQVGQELLYKHTITPGFLQMSPHSPFQTNALKVCHTPRSSRTAQTRPPLHWWGIASTREGFPSVVPLCVTHCRTIKL